MAEYKWPEEGKRTHIGKRIKRLDGPDKVSGKAKYTFDMNRPGMLFGKVLRSPYAHAKIVSVESINASSASDVDTLNVEELSASRFREIFREIMFNDDVIVDVGASNVGWASRMYSPGARPVTRNVPSGLIIPPDRDSL